MGLELPNWMQRLMKAKSGENQPETDAHRGKVETGFVNRFRSRGRMGNTQSSARDRVMHEEPFDITQHPKYGVKPSETAAAPSQKEVN